METTFAFHRRHRSNQQKLTLLLEEAIGEARARHRRDVSPEEVLDHLFSRNRQDPEACFLEKRLKPQLKRLLGESAKA